MCDRAMPGILKLCGMHDVEANPLLLCSYNDKSAGAYDLPSFSERERIYAKQEVRIMQRGPGGLFFTGDGNSQVRVCNWLAERAVKLKYGNYREVIQKETHVTLNETVPILQGKGTTNLLEATKFDDVDLSRGEWSEYDEK